MANQIKALDQKRDEKVINKVRKPLDGHEFMV